MKRLLVLSLFLNSFWLFSQHYRFKSAGEEPEFLENYFVLIYKNDDVLSVQSNNRDVRLDRFLINSADSIFLNANLNLIKLEKSMFEKSVISVDMEHQLNPVVITSENRIDFQFIGIEKHSKPPFVLNRGSKYATISTTNRFSNGSIVSILFHLKGKNIFVPASNENVHVEILIGFFDQEDLSDLDYSSLRKVESLIVKRRSHWFEVDLTTLDLSDIGEYKYMIYSISPLNSSINIKTSSAKYFDNYKQAAFSKYENKFFIHSFLPDELLQIKFKIQK